MSDENRARHNASTVCCICRNSARLLVLDDPQWRKVADHDHVTGFYIGTAHDLCNRLRRVTYKIPVFVHNLRGYDGHIGVQLFIKYCDRKIKQIGHTMKNNLQVK